jgi:hypothetical protein
MRLPSCHDLGTICTVEIWGTSSDQAGLLYSDLFTGSHWPQVITFPAMFSRNTFSGMSQGGIPDSQPGGAPGGQVANNNFLESILGDPNSGQVIV